MVDDTTQHARQRGRTSESREELRTIAFRLREIQRLLAVRAEQENRRLQADGHDPVTDTNLFRREFDGD